MYVYGVAGEKTSPLWCEAFAQGCGGRVTYGGVLKPGDVAVFGSPRLSDLVGQAKAQGRTWYYGDKAYFGRGMYYRCTRNGYMQTQIGHATPARWERLGWKIKPWRTGSTVLVCPQSEAHFKHHGQDRGKWLQSVLAQLKQHTDRKVVVRDKVGINTEAAFAHQLANVHAVVVFTSVAGVQAAMHGVPCFATHECAASLVGDNDLANIEQPKRPDNREQLAWWLADNQWTLREMKRGQAWERLGNGLGG
jgi:hypothetical protein